MSPYFRMQKDLNSLPLAHRQRSFRPTLSAATIGLGLGRAKAGSTASLPLLWRMSADYDEARFAQNSSTFFSNWFRSA